MEKLQICRVCLIEDVHYLIENTQYQYVYEKLTSIQLQTNDLKPRTVCYICYAKLQTIRRFMLQCLKAEKVLTEMLNNNNEIELQETIDRLIPNSFRLRATAIEQNNIDSDVEDDVITQDIKHEQDDEMQDIYEPEPVVTETDLELQIKKFEVAHSGEETDIADIDEYIRKAVARLAREHKARDEKSVAPITNMDNNTDKVHQSDHKACLMCSKSSTEKDSSCPSTDKPAEGAAVLNTKLQTKKPHIKKPLNAFMLYLKELRPKVMAELCLKESQDINRILGIRWHQLSREEKDKYFAMAKRERQLHMQRYPGWASRRKEPRRRKRTRPDPTDEGFEFKKCRARYGLEQVNLWCKPCRIKKKCVRYMEALAAATGGTVPRGKRRRRKRCSEENAKPSVSNDGDASSPEDLKALSTLASEPKQPEPTDRAPIIRSLLNLPQKSIPEPQTLSRGYINPTLNEKNPSIGWSATMPQTDFRT